MELERRSSGVAKAGLATGIVGTSLGTLGVLGALGNGAGALLGRQQPVVMMENGGYPAGGRCSEDHYVNRYELELQQKIAEKDSQIALRDANTYNNQIVITLTLTLLIADLITQLLTAAIQVGLNTHNIICSLLVVDSLSGEGLLELTESSINVLVHLQALLIVTYANATFYPKLIADITAGTTTTPQSTFNPIPQGNDCCRCGN